MPGIIARLTINDGSQEEFVEAMGVMHQAVKENEPGCLYYDLFRSDEPTVFVILERYADDEAFAKHGKTDHMRAFGKKVTGLLAGPPAIEILKD